MHGILNVRGHRDACWLIPPSPPYPLSLRAPHALAHPVWTMPPPPAPLPGSPGLPHPPPGNALPDLLRAVGSWSRLEGLVPWGLHSGSHGVLWSLELRHLHVGLAVGCRTWGLGSRRGSDRLCPPGHVTLGGAGLASDSGLRARGAAHLCVGPRHLQRPQGDDVPACASPHSPLPRAREGGPFLPGTVLGLGAVGWAGRQARGAPASGPLCPFLRLGPPSSPSLPHSWLFSRLPPVCRPRSAAL